MLAHIRIVLISSCILFALTELYAQTQRKDEKVCENRSKEVNKYMNLAVDPCDDFYEFACGNWTKYHVITNDDEIITPISLAQTAIENDVINILSELVRVDDSIVNRKIKTFYKSCLTAERNGPTHQAFLSHLVKKYGGFPAVPGSHWNSQNVDYDWQKIVAQIMHDFSLNILIGITIIINPGNLREFSILFSEPDTILPTELCNHKITQRINVQDSRYETIELEVAENLKGWLTLEDDVAKRIAIDIISFEFELCKGMGRSEVIKSDPDPVYIYKFRKSLYEHTATFNETINFMDIVSESFAHDFKKPVFMNADKYYTQLIQTINDHNPSIIANYIMYRTFDAFNIPSIRSQTKRSNFCVSKIKQYYSSIISDMFRSRYLQKRNDIDDIFNYLKTAMSQSLQGSWISNLSKRSGERKLEQMELIQYTNTTEELKHLEWLQVDAKNYWTNLAQAMARVKPQQREKLIESDTHNNNAVNSFDINVVYSSNFKQFEVGGGLQLEPFYHNQYPHAMRFALFGSIVGKELVTEFNDLSWTSPYLGVEMWDKHTSEEYINRAQCFKKQISSYLYNNRKPYNNMTRVRHLIAKSGGLNIAFNAYLKWLNFKNPNNDFSTLSQETLKNVNYSNTQLFFIAFAQMHCKSEKTQIHRQPIISPLDQHNLVRYEVNGPLRNSVDFALEFGCALGTHMNPPDKCIIY